jgi:uncharacterized damage-inducible protein DinB
MKQTKPAPGTYGAYYQGYIEKMPEGNILEMLEEQRHAFAHYIRQLSDEQLDIRYAPEKWTIRDVMVHLIDCERVFVCRALCFSRGEQQSLPGFDQEAYIRDTDCTHRHALDLTEEFDAVRRASISFFRSLTNEQWRTKGIANEKPMTTHAIAWIIAGHLKHHWDILKERYSLTAA